MTAEQLQTKPILLTQIDTLEKDSLELRHGLQQPNGLHGVLFQNFLSKEECAELLTGVYTLRPYWRQGTQDGEYTLGRVWYTALDNRDVIDYFEEVSGFNALIDQSFPGLIPQILDFSRKFAANDSIKIRPGFAGPGFVIFTPRSLTAKEGGAIHIDCEGLSTRMLDVPGGAEVYSLMISIQLPEEGGFLRTWPDYYQPSQKDKYLNDIDIPLGRMEIVPYEVGGISVISSPRVHQIEPYSGCLDRVILTFHLGKIDNEWLVWF